MAGPNGCGKSSLFDAMNKWHHLHGLKHAHWEELYHGKKGLPPSDNSGQNAVRVVFHEPLPPDGPTRQKLFYVRSAYRSEADFSFDHLSKVGDDLSGPRIRRLIDNDVRVKDNYQRLVSHSVSGLYSGEHDDQTVPQLREVLIGQVRESMGRVFDDLVLRGPGDPLRDGSFFFEKGTSCDFHYKNLSGGEKAAFDLLLDFIVKRTTYDDTVFCIDEPETHMHTRLQASLLQELFDLIPEKCQLWIATHSIGMMRRARDLQEENPDKVVFIDFFDQDFDQPVTLQPKQVDRAFWANTLSVALDDLAHLVAPKRVVLCEGRPARAVGDDKAEFDAKCYRKIFNAEFADTDFFSVGNASEVQADTLQVGKTIQALVSGTNVVRLVDRDDRSEQEIFQLGVSGVRVLSRRNLEAYLLDDSVLQALCVTLGHSDKMVDVLEAKQRAIAASVARGNAVDDVKSAAGDTYTAVKRILALSGCGNNTEAFMRDTLAPLFKPGLAAYDALKCDIFGPRSAPYTTPHF